MYSSISTTPTSILLSKWKIFNDTQENIIFLQQNQFFKNRFMPAIYKCQGKGNKKIAKEKV
jgi:hypothetical protein